MSAHATVTSTVDPANLYAIRDDERDAAASWARPWLNAVARSSGVYPVTVGGYVVGQVERHAVATSKTALWWSATDADGKRFAGAFHSRADAMDVLARTDHAVLCYRDAARLGAFGTAEQARQARDDAALQGAIDAEAKAERQAAEAKAERAARMDIFQPGAREDRAERAAEAAIAVIRFAVGHKLTHPEFGEATVFAVRPQIVHGVPSVRYGVEFANGGAWDITGKGWTRVTD